MLHSQKVLFIVSFVQQLYYARALTFENACQVVDLVCSLAWRQIAARRVAAAKLLRLQAIVLKKSNFLLHLCSKVTKYWVFRISTSASSPCCYCRSRSSSCRAGTRRWRTGRRGLRRRRVGSVATVTATAVLRAHQAWQQRPALVGLAGARSRTWAQILKSHFPSTCCKVTVYWLFRISN